MSSATPNPATPNPATIWARVIIDELVRAGVREVCLAPGSRSTPLVLAAARRDELRMRVFIDERSAAFFALGLAKGSAKGSGAPAVVLTTSGTAVANLLPAAVEAHQAEVPLILLTADRPPRLRDLDANQAIHQPGIFGVNTRWAADLAPPSLDEAALRHLRGQVVRGVALARGLPAGPVHLNVPFDKPLEPSEADDAWWRAHGEATGAATGAAADHDTPFTRISLQRPRLGDAEIQSLVDAVQQAERGVIVAGAHPEAAQIGPLLRAFAARTGFVLLADPLSGARSTAAADSDVAESNAGESGAAIASTASLWLSDAAIAKALAPDLIVRIGAAPTSAAVLSWLELHGGSGPQRARQIVIDAGQRWKDHTASATDLFRGCPIDALTRVMADLNRATPEGGAWTKQWMAADTAARQAVQAEAGPWHEGHVAQAVTNAVAQTQTALFVSSSMPIRDVEAYGGDALTAVHGNRGASGIDGIVSTALGVAAGAGQPAVALIGDLALLHDMNGLLATRESDARVIFVVVQNDGGGIFHMLPIAEHEPAFTPFFATPHGLDVAQIAALYSLPHRCVESPEELNTAVQSAVREASEPDTGGAASGSQIIEIRTDREANREGHARVRTAVQAAVRIELPSILPN